jgi:hypothetical protein
VAESLSAIKTALSKVKTLDDDRAALEGAQRVELVTELVKLGFETPATAWKKDAAGAATRVPCARLSSEPIAELRERVTALRATKKGAPPEPPTTPDGDISTLTPAELSACKTANLEPATYLARKRGLVVRR